MTRDDSNTERRQKRPRFSIKFDDPPEQQNHAARRRSVKPVSYKEDYNAWKHTDDEDEIVRSSRRKRSEIVERKRYGLSSTESEDLKINVMEPSHQTSVRIRRKSHDNSQDAIVGLDLDNDPIQKPKNQIDLHDSEAAEKEIYFDEAISETKNPEETLNTAQNRHLRMEQKSRRYQDTHYKNYSSDEDNKPKRSYPSYKDDISDFDDNEIHRRSTRNRVRLPSRQYSKYPLRNRRGGTPKIKASRHVTRNLDRHPYGDGLLDENLPEENLALAKLEIPLMKPTPKIRLTLSGQHQSRERNPSEQESDFESTHPVVDSSSTDGKSSVSEDSDHALDSDHDEVRALRRRPNVYYGRGRRNAYKDEEESEVENPRKLRKRNSVNYAIQMMPKNLGEILDNEARDIIDREDRERERRRNMKRWNSGTSNNNNLASPFSARNRLNDEDDDIPAPLPEGRIFSLFGKQNTHKNAILPINMNQLMQAEEAKLMQGLDDETKALFMAQKHPENDSDPMCDVDFSDVAGLDQHINSLKEMVAFPIQYPEIFSQFGINSPKGVLFHGPPGTGKTLVARALASSCSTSTKPVAFFVRKGADILSKWVGESERQLRLLFEQAKAWQPSIIFFDEIDGKQDQIHSSVVSTFLALMDGIDNRGQVIVIGATNRIDSIDPALRRPGRFDREFYFGLPNESARRQIIERQTLKWIPSLTNHVKDHIAALTRGYNGADVKALCTEAALHAVRRLYPQMYDSKLKLKIDAKKIVITERDFLGCISNMLSSTDRSSGTIGKQIQPHIQPLLHDHFQNLHKFLVRVIPILQQSRELPNSSMNKKVTLWAHDYLKGFEPRMLISGMQGMGQHALGEALVQEFEAAKFYIQDAEGIIVQAFREIKRHKCAVIYLPLVDRWWMTVCDSVRQIFFNLLDQHRHFSYMLLATSECVSVDLGSDFSDLFSCAKPSLVVSKEVYEVSAPSKESLTEFFRALLSDVNSPPELIRALPTITLALETIEEDELTESVLTDTQSAHLVKEEEQHRRATRQHLSNINEDLRKSFRLFSKPVYELYPNVRIDEPMDLGIVDDKIQQNAYELVNEYLDDINIIVEYSQRYNNPENINQKDHMVKAKKLGDVAAEHAHLLPPDFLKACKYFYMIRRSNVSIGLPCNIKNIRSNVIDLEEGLDCDLIANGIDLGGITEALEFSQDKKSFNAEGELQDPVDDIIVDENVEIVGESQGDEAAADFQEGHFMVIEGDSTGRYEGVDQIVEEAVNEPPETILTEEDLEPLPKRLSPLDIEYLSEHLSGKAMGYGVDAAEDMAALIAAFVLATPDFRSSDIAELFSS